MAECHPVGFQWVMEAKARGATVIHVDPRFTRTSAVADLHVPLRAGTDIAFLGGIINYVLKNERYFRDYVLAYTNARHADRRGLPRHRGPRRRVLRPGRRGPHLRPVELAVRGRPDRRPPSGEREQARPSGRVTGPPDGRRAVRRTAPAGPGITGESRTDETLQHPRCVFQVLKRHFARYTPEMVEQICGIPPEQFRRVCELLDDNSGRDRTTAFVYAVGWTHHTVGVQYIRAAAILQTLLGNIGRPGAASWRCAGTPRSRARPTSRRCSTCCPATSRCRTRTATRTWTTTSTNEQANKGSGPTCAPTWSACSRHGGATPRPRTTTSASTTCRA